MNKDKTQEKKEIIEKIRKLENQVIKALVKNIMLKILINKKIKIKNYEKSSIEKIFNDCFKPIFLSGEKNRNFKEKEIIDFFFNMAVKENRKNNINKINDAFKNM